ncbi:6-hydroxymethylpterin diphosphokinase MptE-like protein [Marinobacter metalliresistant]|uniref:DUF115 domain-containing protein n=1 Tax=Marinobacter metalliresistant TaxID=2961995 RepID=A0ABZ2W4Y1_9GAMM
MSESDQDIAAQFVQRKQRNLAYFMKYRPEIYEYFSDLQLDHAELVVTPGLPDVDLLDRGQSVYRGLAKEYSIGEARQFLQENSQEKKLVNYPPPFTIKGDGNRLARHFLHECFRGSMVTRENFSGYFRGRAIPSMVFLGCGLGYHIEYMVDNASIIDAVVFEPDAERFALTLFTIDWENICEKFRKRGRAISFSIATVNSEENVRVQLGQKLAETLPLYPYLTLYYNHLANVDLFRIAKDLERDIPILGANWSSYDFEVRNLRNVYHNIESGVKYLQPGTQVPDPRPVLIVGSGPSIDNRLDDILRVRESVVLVSAGTGLRGLLESGLCPDIHVEVDTDYLIYKLLEDLSERHDLSGITLVADIAVNPLITSLFEKTVFYFPSSTHASALTGFSDYGVGFCYPTCTNAAVSLSYSMGFRNLFLFGTDYGYRDKSKDHSRLSVFGETARTDFEKSVSEKSQKATIGRPTFQVTAVDGSSILTRSDYYSAKRSLEGFVAHVQAVGDEKLCVFNCSDGAAIDDTQWLSSAEFLECTERLVVDKDFSLSDFLNRQTGTLEAAHSYDRFVSVVIEIKETAQFLLSILKHARLDGRADLVEAANQVRSYLNRVGKHSGRASPVSVQYAGWQLVSGTVQRFLQIGLCHGLAHPDDADLVKFARHWRKAFSEFLQRVPDHCALVLLDDAVPERDPWVTRRIWDPEPDYE